MAEAAFDPDTLLKSARRLSDLEDYGDDRFRAGLDRFCSSLRDQNRLSESGRHAVTGDIVEILVNRLRVQHDLASHSDIAEEQVLDPLIITGLPRTGTTKLQQIIAQDPNLLKIPYWLAINPARFPGHDDSAEDPRIAVAAERLKATAAYTPEVLSAHPSQLHDPEEEAFPMRMTFEAQSTGMFDYVPDYLHWLAERPQKPGYDYLHVLLQYWQWQFGGGQGRAWVLKTPAHLSALETILCVFPGAVIVHCHRDPVVAMPSMLRMYEAIARARGNDVSPAEVGELYVPYWADRTAENRHQRRVIGDRLRILDVQYDDIVDDCPTVIKTIYGAWGRELTPDAECRMAAWERNNPQHRHGKHTYSLERFGLTEGTVLAAFEHSSV